MDENKRAVAVFNKLADLYQQRFMNVDLYADTFDFFCGVLGKNNPEVLELACGPGNISRYLLHKRPDIQLLGTDLAPNMVELARGNNPEARFDVMDARVMRKLNRTFDALICGFCLPYFSMQETKQLIQDAAGVLKEEGLIYVSTMEDDYGKSGLRKGSTGDEIFMHYYLASDLEPLLKEHGFNLLKAERKLSTGNDGIVVTDLILIARKSTERI